MLLVALHDLAVFNDAAPSLHLFGLENGASHDVATEVPQLGTCPAALGPPQIAGLLEEPLWVVLENHQDPSQARSELVEGHCAVDVPLLPRRAPDDALVGHLLDDRGLPGAVTEEDLRLELELLVILRLDVLHLLHEAREGAEFSPLVVGDRDRHADVD